MIRVGVYDQRPLYRLGLSSVCGTLGDDISSLALDDNPSLAIGQIKEAGVGVVLTTLPAEGGGSLEFVHALCQRFERLRCVVLLTADSPQAVSRCLKAGAKGVLSCQARPDELKLAIMTVRGGYEYLSANLTGQLSEAAVAGHVKSVANDDAPNTPTQQTAAATSQQNDMPLSDRQVEILRLWGANLSNKDIADKLFLSVRTVESHKNHIMQKLNLKTTVDIVRFAIRNNIIDL